MDNLCPLCGSTHVASYYQDTDAHYYDCKQCRFIFTLPAFHLDADSEKARYDQHKNDPNDANYRAFLAQVYDPVVKELTTGAKGLDFGCGPGPTLSIMFEEVGYQVDLFDKYYANNLQVFSRQYDFITATEVIEHLDKPAQELDRLFGLLKPGGVLAVMTKMHDQLEDFSQWYYKDDPTHIGFFHTQTMEYLANSWGAKLEIPIDNVALFYR